MDYGRSVAVPLHRLVVVLGPVGYSVLCVPALIAIALEKRERAEILFYLYLSLHDYVVLSSAWFHGIVHLWTCLSVVLFTHFVSPFYAMIIIERF